MQTDPARLRDFAVRYTAAWCSQDPASVAAFFSPGASLTVNNGTPAVGRSEITALAQSFMTTFPDLQVVMDDVRVLADRPEYHWTLIGTNTGPGGTGHRVRISGFERWRMGTDGLIAVSEGQFDAADYRSQLEHGVPEPH
ncbi:MAG TPA: nuclear transport factor 2 family protein [Bryobacteraceae bacterium]|nr:nuclear transport factor 2 family protein [Bryobacteraceae bacterium]